jgi:phosphoenolpyruvate phosphomutase
VERCRKQQIESVVVVAGYMAEHIDVGGIDIVRNPRHATTGELASLQCARHLFRDDLVVMYGDLIFRSYVLRGLMESDRELTVVVDSHYANGNNSGTPDYAYCSVADDRSLWGQDVLLERISSQREEQGVIAHGRWIGMLRTRARGREWLESALDSLAQIADFDRLGMGDLLNHIVARGHPVRVIYIHGHWLDVNSIRDLEQAGHFTVGQR